MKVQFVGVRSLLGVDDIYWARYEPIPLPPSKIEGHACFHPAHHTGDIYFRSSGSFTTAQGKIALLLQFDSGAKTGYYTPEDGVIIVHWSRFIDLPNHWLSIYGSKTSVCWEKEGF